jgi:four helix bundle protein
MTPIQNFTDLKVWQRSMELVVDINHLNIALGSEGELFTQLECGRRLGFATDPKPEKYFDDLSQVGRMLRGLV